MKLSPKTQRRYKDLLKMPCTISVTRRSGLHLGHDGRLYLWNKGALGGVSLTRAEFQKFVRFYEAGQELKKEDKWNR